MTTKEMNATVDRLRAHADMRPVAIPDTDGEVHGALAGLDDLVAMIAPGHEEVDPELDVALSPDARDAVGRLAVAVRVAEAGSPAQPIAPDGRCELIPIAWAHVETADLIQLGLAVQALGRIWASRSDELVTDVLTELASAGYFKPEDLIAQAARLHGLLSLPWDDTVSTLFAVLPPGAGRVVLDQGAHAAYQRLVDRILGIWHAGDPLAPYLYRGGT